MRTAYAPQTEEGDAEHHFLIWLSRHHADSTWGVNFRVLQPPITRFFALQVTQYPTGIAGEWNRRQRDEDDPSEQLLPGDLVYKINYATGIYDDAYAIDEHHPATIPLCVPQCAGGRDMIDELRSARWVRLCILRTHDLTKLAGTIDEPYDLSRKYGATGLHFIQANWVSRHPTSPFAYNHVGAARIGHVIDPPSDLLMRMLPAHMEFVHLKLGQRVIVMPPTEYSAGWREIITLCTPTPTYPLGIKGGMVHPHMIVHEDEPLDIVVWARRDIPSSWKSIPVGDTRFYRSGERGQLVVNARFHDLDYAGRHHGRCRDLCNSFYKTQIFMTCMLDLCLGPHRQHANRFHIYCKAGRHRSVALAYGLTQLIPSSELDLSKADTIVCCACRPDTALTPTEIVLTIHDAVNLPRQT